MGRAKDSGPRFLAWWLATISLVLPVIGILLALIGAGEMARGGSQGWLLYVGLACIVLDLVIDTVWAHPSVSLSDEPDLNARGSQLAGRLALVEEPIAHGRGKVRVGDTIWQAEGPDTPAGTNVRITMVKGTIVVVVRASPV
jgi:hypothetical protein